MSDGLVTYENRDGVAIIQMDDGKVNALSYEMLSALAEALDRADAEAKAIVLVGRPGRFCAGFDLKTMMASPESAIKLLTVGSDLFMRLYGSAIPVVIACSGHAVAGGALLTLCGDVRIGLEGDFKVGLNEVAIQMPLPILAIEMARDRLSGHELTAATLGAKLYDSSAAVEAGYLDRVVPPDALMSSAVEAAAALGAYNRFAFSQSKRRLRGATIAHIHETLEADMAAFMPPSR
jgi:enoyl-CoA hydratase